MISYLNGKIIQKGAGFIVILTGGVGYKVFLAPVFLAGLKTGDQIELFTHQYIREEAVNLYGFKDLGELELFELLIGISGIGPKSALGIMSISSAEDVKQSIASGDSGLLTKVSGIGRKTAERVVLELREKIGKLSAGAGKVGGGVSSGDEIDALMALGYSLPQAREALNRVDAKIKDSGERIRQALKRLGK